MGVSKVVGGGWGISWNPTGTNFVRNYNAVISQDISRGLIKSVSGESEIVPVFTTIAYAVLPF